MRRFWLEGLAVLVALATALSPLGAEDMRAAVPLRAEDIRAAVPLRPQQKAVFNEIARQLGEDRSFALVIGISDFDRLPRLHGVQPEADLIAATFAAQGFHVERAGAEGRLTKSELKARIADFLNKRGGRADNRLVVYVATHGYAASDRTEIGFLAASDTVQPGGADFEASAYSVRELSAALTGIAAQHIYLFFNACFSGAMLPDPVRGEQKPSVAKPSSLKALSPEVAAWTLELLSHNARLVLTAGSDRQTVPDVDNPYSRAIADGLAGEADADGDGLVLGSELAPFVRGRVARETRLKGNANDAVFAVLPKLVAPQTPRADAPPKVDYSLQGDFVFLSPKGARDLATEGRDELAEILAARAKRLPAGQFVECADCPVMVKMPGDRIALGRTEVTFAEWDACYREFGCRRYLPDEGNGRGDHPAAGMTWQDALEYTLWLDSKKEGLCKSYRLPKKAEWLSAAGTGANAYGIVAEQGRASCRGCGAGRDEGEALAVATLPADPLGTHDITGNLWEWVGDGPACGFADLREKNICSGEGTVMGGSFATAAASLTRELEGHLPRTSGEWPFSWPTVGLRVACDMM